MSCRVCFALCRALSSFYCNPALMDSVGVVFDKLLSDLSRVVRVMLLGMQVAFPYLYNNRPRKVRLSPYHYPMVMYIKMEDPDLPAFYYDPLIHPIAFYKSDAPTGTEALDDDEEDAFTLPEGEWHTPITPGCFTCRPHCLATRCLC